MILKRYGKLLAILLSVLAFNLIYFDTGIPLPGTLSFLVFIGLSILFFLLTTPKPPRTGLMVFGLSLISTFFGLYTAAPFARFLSAVVSVGLLCLGVYLTVTHTNSTKSLSEALLIPFSLGIGWLKSLFSTKPPKELSSTTNSSKWRTALSHSSIPFSKLLRGLLLTIPFAFLMIALLSSADPVFGRLIHDLLRLNLPDIPQELIWRFLLTLMVLVITVPLLKLKLTQSPPAFFAPKAYAGFTTEALVLISSLSVILGVFLLIQFRYLFTTVPETQLHQFGVQTYSEYVRRGFTELSLVTVIVYLATGLSYIISRAKNYTYRPLNVATSILLGLTLLFIFSIFRRVHLYQVAHGLSVARVYGMVFLGFITSILLVLGLRLDNRIKAPWHLLEIGLFSLFALLPSLIKPDSLVANLNPPTVNKEVDYVYISNLSADAVEGWVSSYNQVLNWLSLNEGVFEQSEITDEQYRQLFYHQLTLNNLIKNYEYLTAIYGQEEVASTLQQSVGNHYDPEYLGFLRRNHLAFYNLSEDRAYQQLHGAISPAEIVAIQQRISTFLSTINANRLHQYQFDRSFDTPLVD